MPLKDKLARIDHEGGLEVADANYVVVVERRARGDGLVIDVGPVTALLILDVVAVLDADDLSVLTGNGSRGDDNIAIGITTAGPLTTSSKLPFISNASTTCCGVPTTWRRRRRGEPSVFRVVLLSCSGLAVIFVIVMRRGRSAGTA
jgi:hypothetical protein